MHLIAPYMVQIWTGMISIAELAESSTDTAPQVNRIFVVDKTSGDGTMQSTWKVNNKAGQRFICQQKICPNDVGDESVA